MAANKMFHHLTAVDGCRTCCKPGIPILLIIKYLYVCYTRIIAVNAGTQLRSFLPRRAMFTCLQAYCLPNYYNIVCMMLPRPMSGLKLSWNAVPSPVCVVLDDFYCDSFHFIILCWRKMETCRHSTGSNFKVICLFVSSPNTITNVRQA
jgi:hypothetical protein